MRPPVGHVKVSVKDWSAAHGLRAEVNRPIDNPDHPDPFFTRQSTAR
jgi:hypothetical protein